VAPRTLGWPLSMIVLVTLEREGMRTIDELMGKLEAQPEVIEAWQITGEYDFAVKVVARNMEDYDALTHRLFAQDERVRSFEACGQWAEKEGEPDTDSDRFALIRPLGRSVDAALTTGPTRWLAKSWFWTLGSVPHSADTACHIASKVTPIAIGGRFHIHVSDRIGSLVVSLMHFRAKLDLIESTPGKCSSTFLRRLSYSSILATTTRST